MSVHPLRLFPDHILASPSQVVTHFDSRLTSLLRDLLDTLYSGPGVGLAAPQIGVPKRVSVIDVSRNRNPNMKGTNHGLIEVINPVLLEGTGVQIPREGCLSVPDLLANVNRFQHVKVQFADREGNNRLIEADGFEALALQHEIDHLDGKLFLDRVSNIKSDVFRRKSYH